jgi:hypothetical protein
MLMHQTGRESGSFRAARQQAPLVAGPPSLQPHLLAFTLPDRNGSSLFHDH